MGQRRQRDYYGIKRWMWENHLKGVQVAGLAKTTSPVVSATITGKENHRRVLRVLYDLGCPDEFLALPPGLLEEFAA